MASRYAAMTVTIFWSVVQSGLLPLSRRSQALGLQIQRPQMLYPRLQRPPVPRPVVVVHIRPIW
jgi:hypothetical protein